MKQSHPRLLSESGVFLQDRFANWAEAYFRTCFAQTFRQW